MRTSLNKLQEIEEYVLGTAQPGGTLIIEARMIIDHNLVSDIALQKQTYSVINQYGRRRLKQELEQVHQQLFTQPEYRSIRQKIMALFR